MFRTLPYGPIVQPVIPKGVKEITVHLPRIDDHAILNQGQIEPANPGRHRLIHNPDHAARGLLIRKIPVICELHPYGVLFGGCTNTLKACHTHLISYQTGQSLVFSQ